MSRTSELRAIERLVASDPLDDELEDLAAGELDDDARAALEASPAAQARLEIVRPLDERERAAIAARLVALTPPSASARAMPRRMPRLSFAISSALALAAALALVIWARGEGTSLAAPLPAYALELSAGASPTRAVGAADPTRVTEGTAIEIVLRPERDATTPVHAALYLREGRSLRRLDVAPTIAPSGAVRFAGIAGRDGWTLPAGQIELVAIVASQPLLSEAALERAPGEVRFELELEMR